jgi:HSP20 family protein
VPESQEEPLPRWGLQARPDVDVAERSDELHVWCDLPGCAEETIELSGDEWTLYVSAERAEEYWEESGLQRRERSRHAERSISLPARADIDAVEASFEDGVLFVRAPKHESARTQTIGFE